ncbi:50S ribosomal protein L25 [Candidatus Falkowbacteria bacterium CG10_big_fil_rev_8_21_14_0_10_39_9]|uniref:Large ribosomal subunit protein bL25 n=1 Tax=Candidatus Falkowbacteria bacterium CG10_big_fil_rev_8_21_14_0_10_39_9 TaxID=1974566 RepID=A0A2M6WQU1_9BACT|nr:MAG: 50S ribosomal protein L25 [Candidatus Falkowbacteria bacterium CG10_big_fil_rev_8_21_14_0_10_39_9]
MEIKLTAQARELKEKLAKDVIPAVLYGPGLANLNLKLRRVDLEKAVAAGGESALVDLEIDGGKSVKVLLKDIQFHPLKNNVAQHVDLYQVDMKKKITTEIPVHFVGESRAVKELGGMLIKTMDAIEVECLPTDLVGHIDIDLSVLKEIHDSVKVSDLKLGAGIHILNDMDADVVTVAEQQVEEVIPVVAPVEATPAVAATKEGATPATDAKKDKK